jgi:hypothetical protein
MHQSVDEEKPSWQCMKSLNSKVSVLRATPKKFLNFTFCVYHNKIIPLQVCVHSWPTEQIKARFWELYFISWVQAV